MKKVLSALPKMGLLVFVLFIFIYHKITHMDKNDLEWTKNRYVDEMFIFKSQDGVLDTAIVTNVEIYNSINPINTNYNASDEYIACASVDYKLVNRKDSIEGWFYIMKKDNKKPVNISVHLGSRYAFYLEQKLTCMKVEGTDIDDVMLFDDSNSELKENAILDDSFKSFAWSRKYGLVQYTFIDGTIFTRVGLK